MVLLNVTIIVCFFFNIANALNLDVKCGSELFSLINSVLNYSYFHKSSLVLLSISCFFLIRKKLLFAMTGLFLNFSVGGFKKEQTKKKKKEGKLNDFVLNRFSLHVLCADWYTSLDTEQEYCYILLPCLEICYF